MCCTALLPMLLWKSVRVLWLRRCPSFCIIHTLKVLLLPAFVMHCATLGSAEPGAHQFYISGMVSYPRSTYQCRAEKA